ncbi:MAG: hypothetical protein AB1529_00130 [Candidatus Micrarchaeota archaeon]
MSSPHGIWYRNRGPTFAGKAKAIAKGVFISGEPLVEYADYMLRVNGLSADERLKQYSRIARSGDSDRIFEKLMQVRDPRAQAVLAAGFERCFDNSIESHKAEDTSQYAAAAMLAHWGERRRYVQKVEAQAKEFLKKFWVESEEAKQSMASVLEKIESLKGEGWMKEDKRF